jgi:sec-independent protein translocase protein TatA
MGSFSIWHILIFATVALLLFGGKGKVSDLMGDFGRGVSSFKKGLGESDKDEPKVISDQTGKEAANTEKDEIRR